MEKINYEGLVFLKPDFHERLLYRSKTTRAVLKKILFKKPCEICGDIEVHAHHEKYAEYLNVRWLCPIHHKKIHSLFNKINSIEESNEAIISQLNLRHSYFFEILYKDNLKFIKEFYDKFGLQIEKQEIKIEKS
jgi:hypothetical protein